MDKTKDKTPTPSTTKPTEMNVNKGTFIQYKKGQIETDYTIGEIMGSGAFATVRKVTHKDSNNTRALKIIKKNPKQDSSRMYLEVDILKKLIHPNIMQIFEFYEDKKNFYIITEFCEGGELFDKVVEKGSFKEDEAAAVVKQLISAINYIHLNNIVHRDLKPENILLDTKKNNIIKIIDWGTARFFDKDKNKKMNKISGTPYYIAPEVLFEKYDEKCDIWSCGVIMYILLCGYPPFNGETDNEILAKIKSGKFSFPEEEWKGLSNECKELIQCMLEFDPKKRYSAQQCLAHPWLTERNKKGLDNNLTKRALTNMKKFHAERKLQQASLTYIVNHLMSKEDKNEMHEIFSSFDKNGDGVLSREEIFEGYKSILGEVEATKEVDRIMKEADLDKSGSIDYNEFLIACSNRQKLLNKEKLEATFKMFDKDGNGSISAKEIKDTLGGALGGDAKLLDQIINEVDDNGDKEISLKEFKEMMLKFLS
jgi:calcium-dependent protein kinase